MGCKRDSIAVASDPGRFLTQVAEELRPVFHRCTVPLIGQQNGRPASAGTGFLLSVADSVFMVTAAHVVNLHLEHKIDLFLPEEEGYATGLVGEVVQPQLAEKMDIAVVRLPDELAGTLRGRGFEFVRMDQTVEVNTTALPRGGYALYGYPGELAKAHADGGFEPVAMHYGCLAFGGDPGELPVTEYDPQAHILLALNKEVRNTYSGEVVGLPALNGMSGCPVWHVYGPSHANGTQAWSPSAARIVGVQSSFYRSQGAIKVIAWQVLKHLLTKMWPDLKAAIELVPSHSPLVRAVIDAGFATRTF